jgi:hypothetical protein
MLTSGCTAEVRKENFLLTEHKLKISNSLLHDQPSARWARRSVKLKDAGCETVLPDRDCRTLKGLQMDKNEAEME